jgi:hypothetical protein
MAGLTDAKPRAAFLRRKREGYLIDQATNEGMPENGRPSRLHEVELALLALERGNAAAGNARPAPAQAAPAVAA